VCGKYLKARQLAKEMEEKAKKTAEMKEEAQNQKERAEEVLESIDSLESDIDLEGLKANFEEGEEKLDDKDFEEAFDIFSDIIEEIQDVVSSKIDDIFDPIRDTLDEIEDDDNIKSLKEDMDEAEEMIQEADMEKALDKAIEVDEKIDEVLEEKLEDEILNLESLFDKLEGKGRIIEDTQELLSKAEYSFEADDYKRAFSLLGEAKEALEGDVDGHIKEIVETLEERIERLRDEGEHLEDIEGSLEKGKSKIDENLIEGWRIIDEKSEEVNRIYCEEILSEGVETLEKEIEEAKDIGAPTEPFEELRDKAENLLEKNDVVELEDILEDSFEKIEEAKFDKVLNTIAESREDFIKAKEMGADIERPMELLKKARNCLKNDDYKEALEWARKGREKVQDLTKKLDEIKDEIQNKSEEINTLEETLNEDFSSLRELTDDARSMLEKKSPEKAVSKLEELDEKIEETSKSKVQDLLDEFEELNETAKDLGLDVGDLSKQQVECKRKLVSSDYMEAASMAISGKENVEKKVLDKVHDEKEKISDELDEISHLDDRFREIEDLVKTVEDNLQEDSTIKAASNIKDARDKLEESTKEISEKILREFTAGVKRLEDIGFELYQIEKYQDRADDAEKRFEEGEAKESLDILLEFIPEFTKELLEASGEELKKAEKAGVDVSELNNTFERSEKKLEDYKFTESIESFITVLEDARNRRQEREEAYEKIKEGASKLSSLEGNKKDDELGSIKNKLEEAKEVFRARKYSDSMKKSEEALDLLKKFEEEDKFFEIKEELKRRLERIAELDIIEEGFEDFDDGLEEIEEIEEKEGISKAQDKVQKKLSELDEVLLEKLGEKISDVNESVEAAGKMGFDVEDHKSDLKKLKSYKDQGRSLEALETLENVVDELKNKKDKGEKAREKLDEVKGKLKKAKIMGAETGGIKDILDQARDDLINDRYSDCLDKIHMAEEKIAGSKEARVTQIIKEFEEKIKELRSKDVDTALAENKLQKAKKAKKRGDFGATLRFAMRSEGELERINKQKIIAKDSLSRVRDVIKKIESENVLLDEAKEEFKRCEQAYESGFYPKAVENALQTIEELNKVLKIHRYLRSFLDSLNVIHKELRMEDKEISSLSECKDEIEELFKNGKYKEAKKEVKKAEKKLRENKSDVKEVINGLAQEIKDKGVNDVDEAVKKLEKARFLLDINNTNKALQNVQKAEDISGLKKLREYKELVSRVQKSMKNAKKFGASVKEVEEIFESAQDKKKSGDILEAYGYIKRANEKVEAVLQDYSPKLKIEVPDTLTIGKWNKTRLHLINEGQALGKDPKIEVRGGDLKELELDDKLKAKEEKELEVKIKPEKENAVIISSALRIFDDEVFEDEQDLKVSMGSEIKTAEESKTCDKCGDEIEKGNEFVLCSCGKGYQKTCAEELGRCPNCGTELETEKEKKEEKKKEKKKRVSLDL